MSEVTGSHSTPNLNVCFLCTTPVAYNKKPSNYYTCSDGNTCSSRKSLIQTSKLFIHVHVHVDVSQREVILAHSGEVSLGYAHACGTSL